MSSRRTTDPSVQVPPNRTRPTEREIKREQVGRGEDWRFPNVQDRAHNDAPGKLFCPECHAISLERRWFLDDRQYEALKADPEARPVLCPGCSAAAHQMYDGEVVLAGDAIWSTPDEKQTAMNLIHNVEAEVRAKNPLARLASVEDRGHEIYILTITPFLAHRLVKEFTKAYGGHFEIDNLPDERFVRARWSAAQGKAEHLRKSEKHGKHAA